tara:strand:- start:3 stop:299 length:297 start_codon:yes stop_codon:yes gene_type:complete
MDNVALGELRELTGDGSQTFINEPMGVVTGNFYKIQLITDCKFIHLYIQGTERSDIADITIPAGTILYNVTSIKISPEVSNATVVAYTNPALTGNIPA